MLVVADSSPLIYLSRVGVLHVLAVLFGDVIVPRAVWEEAVETRPSAPGIDTLRQASWLRVVDNPSPQLDLGLDLGETAAILVAESLHADLLLIDQRLGRKVAQDRGLVVRGTLGVLGQRNRTCCPRSSLYSRRSRRRVFASRLRSCAKMLAGTC